MKPDTDSPLRVIVVDDNRSAAEAVAILLRREHHLVEVFYDGATAIQRLAEGELDLVLTDLRMSPVDGMAVVRAARQLDPPVEAIVFTAYGSVEAAVEAMRLGAADFLIKPVTADQIIQRVRNLKGAPARVATIIGTSDATQRIRGQSTQLASVRSTVLITGETGVGRRHLARWLHQHGPDKERPLLTLQPHHTPAAEELDQAGTLLIPGVDDWDPEAQALLLRQIEGREAGLPPRLIATASPHIDQRAANHDLTPELFFRLAVLVINIPPLRERPSDIAPLLEHFTSLHEVAFGRPGVRPTMAQLEHLMLHGWPGNVRELANLAERAVVLGANTYDMRIRPASTTAVPQLVEGFNLSGHLEEVERMLLVRAIEETNGDRPAIGRLLGLERNTLRYKLNKYGLLDRT